VYRLQQGFFFSSPKIETKLKNPKKGNMAYFKPYSNLGLTENRLEMFCMLPREAEKVIWAL
jgi:hypothetical protein